MPLIYKICPAALWRDAEATGVFEGAPIDRKDGFIHFSTAAQAPETAARHFSGAGDLLLVAVDGDALGNELRFEQLKLVASRPALRARPEADRP